jgi:hydroxymethylpyrimidine/phosphomethylpyrimidine kinase
MRMNSRLPAVLTVAGSDSGGGAGIQADLKTFAALRTHGLTVITSITAQNPDGVSAIEGCSPALVQAQFDAVDAFAPGAAKTGMLYSADVIEFTAAFFKRLPKMSLVVDPVMIATSGASLLKPDAVKALTGHLLPLATLVTPNTDESQALTGVTIKEPEDLRKAARELHRRFGCAALVKGGHLATGRDAIDVYFDGREEWLLEAPRARGVATHGTGCTYSAAIAALLACGRSLPEAVTAAKEYITGAIHGSLRSGGFPVLHWFHTAGK